MYCNGDKSKPSFNNKVEFKVSILKYIGDDSWVDEVLYNIKELLDQNEIPNYENSCSYCEYFKDINTVI